MSKFTMFDGLNTFEGLEYDQIDKVKDFESKAILLQLKPPITVRKGLLLLTDKNVEVLCQDELIEDDEKALKLESSKE